MTFARRLIAVTLLAATPRALVAAPHRSRHGEGRLRPRRFVLEAESDALRLVDPAVRGKIDLVYRFMKPAGGTWRAWKRWTLRFARGEGETTCCAP